MTAHPTSTTCLMRFLVCDRMEKPRLGRQMQTVEQTRQANKVSHASKIYQGGFRAET